jgi:ATP-binding protein involved in chromosome partitioning
MDVRKAMNMFDQVQVPLLGIVENMSYYIHENTGEVVTIFGKGGGDKLSKESGVPLLAAVPIDPLLCVSADNGSHQCGAKTTEAFTQLASKVIDQIKISESTLKVRQVLQKDPRTMSIVWSDGMTQDFKYSDLQKICPCAGCVDEASGKRISSPELVDENVGAKNISAVGRYAIKIQFTSGCTTGLYSFEMLRNCHV